MARKKKQTAYQRALAGKMPKYKGKPLPPKPSPQSRAGKKLKSKKAADKSWTKAVKAQKATGGPTMNTLIKARKMHKKGSPEYNKIQNAINKAYGVAKRHKVAAEKKQSTPAGLYQIGGRVAAPGMPSPRGQRPVAPSPPGILSADGPPPIVMPTPRTYKKGGKVKANNPYGWPTKDARNGGKK